MIDEPRPTPTENSKTMAKVRAAMSNPLPLPTPEFADTRKNPPSPDPTPSPTPELLPEDLTPMTAEQRAWFDANRQAAPDPEPDECKALPEGSGRCAYAGDDGSGACGLQCRLAADGQRPGDPI